MQDSPGSDVELVAINLAGRRAAAAIATCWDAGEAVAVIDAGLSEAAAFARIHRLRPTSIVTPSGRKPARGVGVPAGTAAVVLTSGTTAHPRAAMLTRSGMDAMAEAYSEAIGATGADRWLAALPLGGVAGLAILARSYVTGVPVTVLDAYRTDAVAAAADTASIVSLVPTALTRLLDTHAPIGRFRVILVGGAALPDRLRAAATAAGARIVTTYGLTETWGGIVLDRRPIRDARIRTTDDGEIEIAGPMVMAGYRLDREATSDVFHDGWLRTGDLGVWDGTALTVTGRKGDRIITGGVTVSPTAVERVILDDPRIVDAAVVGVPDEEWGERVVAYIVPANPADVPSLDQIRGSVKDELSAADAPRELRLIDSIPRNEAAKVLRRTLRGR